MNLAIEGAEEISTGGGFVALFVPLEERRPARHLLITCCEDETKIPPADAKQVDVGLYDRDGRQVCSYAAIFVDELAAIVYRLRCGSLS